MAGAENLVVAPAGRATPPPGWGWRCSACWLTRPLFLSQSTLRTIGIGSREDLESMSRARSFQGVHPIIDRVFPFEEARQAFEYFAAGQHFGKVVITH
jgi:NADPH:quinone reductase-like Zn-dependent oxidoreductase